MFDFLGDGTPEIVHTNEFLVSIRDHTGAVLWEEPHSCSGHQNFPLVADIDNDGAAELLLTSHVPFKWYEGARPPDLESAHLPRHQESQRTSHRIKRWAILRGRCGMVFQI